MVNPAIDKEPGPFSYFSKSVDEIGVMDAPLATEITPQGSLYTGYGELVFLTGPAMSPIEPRIRTLEKGYLPIVHFSHTQEGIEYQFTLFAAKLDDGTLVNFARVVETNVSDKPTRAVLTVGSRYQSDTLNGSGTGDHRFRRPVEGAQPGDYRQPGVPFDPEWVYSFSDHAFLRSDKAFYLFSDAPEERMLTPKQYYNKPVDNSPRALHIFPTTLVVSTHWSTRWGRPRRPFSRRRRDGSTPGHGSRRRTRATQLGALDGWVRSFLHDPRSVEPGSAPVGPRSGCSDLASPRSPGLAWRPSE